MRDKKKTPELEIGKRIRSLIKPGHVGYRPKGLTRFVDDLLELGPSDRRRKFQRTVYRLRNRATIEELLSRCAGTWHSDPSEALELAVLADYVALFLPVVLKTGGPAIVSDCRALTSAYVGNCHRLLRQYDLAEEAFVKAYEAKERGTCDPLLAARMWSLHSSLLRDRGESLGALELLRGVAQVHEELGNDHGQGQALLGCAIVLERSGRVEDAIKTHFHGCRLLDDGPPLEAAAAWINLACCLVGSGRPTDARGVLAGLDVILESLPSASSVHLSAAWVEGLAQHALGNLKAAGESLQHVFNSFTARRDHENAALAGLDLARLRESQGDSLALYRALEPLANAPRNLFHNPEARRAIAELVELWRTSQITAQALEAVV